jgi:phage-related protein
MSQLGKAYIEVTADLKKFPAELRTKLKAAMKEALTGVEFTELETKAKAAGERAGNAAGDGFKRNIRKKTEESGRVGGEGFLSGLTKIFDKEKSSKGGFFESISKLFSSATQEGIKGVAEKAGQLANVGGQIGGALSGIGGTIGSIAQVAIIAVLIPVVVQLAGALVQLGAVLFALPAALGVAVAAFAPLIIAFQGFGEAVGAGLSGDVDAFNKALKGLPPSMRSVVKEVVGLKNVFSGVKTSIQEAFFKPLVGVVGPAIRSFLATVGPGLTRIASSLGNVGATLIQTFTSPENLRTFAALLQSTDRIVQTMEPAISNLAQALLNLIGPALPFIERGATAFRDFAANVESFTRGIGKSGALTSWLDRAAHILGALVGLAKDFGHYLIDLLGGEIGDNGTKFLDDFRVKLQDMLVYIQSPDGKESIHNLAVLLKGLADVFIWLIGLEPAALRFFNDFFDAVRAIGHFFAEIGRDVAKGARAVGSFFSDVWDWIKGAGSAIGNFFTETIPSWWDSVVSFFESLPGRVTDALHSFADAGRNAIIEGLKSWYAQVFEWIGNIIGIIWSLPQLIPAAFELLKTNIWNEITALWQGAVDLFWWGVHSTVAVVEAVPGLLSAAGDAIWAFLTELWQRAVVDSYNTVAAGFNRVMDFFYSLPDRIRALGPALYLAAVQLGHKIGDGLANIGTFASDVGHKIVNTIKSGINWVIGSINSGIAEIDDKLPGTLPRIPMLARGAVVDSPTLALVGEAGPEVVVPLGNRQRAQELAEQSGLLSMLRGTGGKGATTVVVYLDPTGVIIPITKTVVRDTLDEQGDALAYARAA